MKRLWIGVAVLLAVLVIGGGLSYAVTALHEGICEELSVAADAACQGHMETALKIGEEVGEKWQRWRHFFASVSDHEPLEEMDSLFEELELYGALRLPVDYAAICLRLSELAYAVGESHSLTWWNFL